MDQWARRTVRRKVGPTLRRLIVSAKSATGWRRAEVAENRCPLGRDRAEDGQDDWAMGVPVRLFEVVTAAAGTAVRFSAEPPPNASEGNLDASVRAKCWYSGCN